MSAHIPLAGVIGDPIAHSRSPRLHGYWLGYYGLTGHYIPMHVRPAQLEAALDGLGALGFRGVNVTLPHKEAALALAADRTEAADRIGAANTLSFRPERGFCADNTDGYGFLQNLSDLAPDWRAPDGPAAILGAGGAARAVVWALLDAGVPELRVSNRTEARAHALAQAFGPRVKVVPWGDAASLWSEVHLAVNTTSLGMSGTDATPFDLTGLSAAATATDLIYTPLDTPFLKAAARLGCRTVDGLGMLLHQAVPGFERWFGTRPRVTAELRDRVLAG